MLLILSVIVALVLILIFRKQIKKYSGVLYVVAAAISIFFLITKINPNIQVPDALNKYIMKPLSRAAFSTALFTIVMYMGVLDKKKSIVKKLFSVRGEISIIACILTLGHNMSYGYSIFPTLFTNPTSMDYPHLIAAIISVILILLMLPLMVTSFITVRKRMEFKTWKKIQRLAYAFYMLIYVHIMCLFVPKIGKAWLNVAAYSVVFLGYALLRIMKYLKDKKSIA